MESETDKVGVWMRIISNVLLLFLIIAMIYYMPKLLESQTQVMICQDSCNKFVMNMTSLQLYNYKMQGVHLVYNSSDEAFTIFVNNKIKGSDDYDG